MNVSIFKIVSDTIFCTTLFKVFHLNDTGPVNRAHRLCYLSIIGVLFEHYMSII